MSGEGESKSALVTQKESKNIYLDFIKNTEKRYKKIFQKKRGKNIEEIIRNWNEGQMKGNLNKCEQDSLFLLLNSNLVYKMWYQIAFLNYIISHKKGWGSQSPERFQEMMKNEFNGSPFKEDVKFKDIITNSYFMRMVFIYEMIKSIHLTRSLIKILPEIKHDKKSWKKITRRRHRRRHRGGQKGGNRDQHINRIMKIFKIGFCAVMWSIVCNNYYEKIETFGPDIEHLIKIHYRDVISQATINELENVRGVIVRYSQLLDQKRPGAGDNKDNYKIRYNDIENQENMKKTKVKQFPEAEKGLIQKSNLQHVAPRESIVPTGTDTPPVSISYSQIASVCGLGLGSMMFGKGDQIVDMVQTFEGEITYAFAKDTINIIKKRIIDIKPVGTTTRGNKNSVLTKVGDVVANLYASIFQGSSGSYTNAPGVQDTITSYQRRATALRQRWNNWQNEANTANVNFIQDIILHIRNTSYYLWVYFVFMQSLEIYAVKKMLELVPGSLENREAREKMLLLVDDDPNTITAIRKSVEEEAKRLGSRGNTIIRGITYWLLVSVFRGLTETIRFQIGRSEGFTQVDIMNSIMEQDIIPTMQQPGQYPSTRTNLPFTLKSSELLSDFRRANDVEIKPKLLREASEQGVDMVLSTGPADRDSFRTANGIRIPDENIEVDLTDIAINRKEEAEYDIKSIVKRGGKREKRKTKKKRKKNKKKTRKKRR